MNKSKEPIAYSLREEAGLITIMRNDVPLETPRNLPVIVPQNKLAECLLQECKEQGDRLDLRKMPMMQMTLTTLDITASKRGEIETGIMRFGENELLCLRADEPAELAASQERVWQPYLDWCSRKFDTRFVSATGIKPPAQTPQTLDKLHSYVTSCDIYRLTGLSEAVGISGSLVLGLALATGYAGAKDIVAASEHDHLWQMKKWGEDPDLLTRNAEIERELGYCEHWFALIT